MTMLSEKVALEYQTVRQGVGWYRLDSEATFELSGKDGVSFLHGMVSNDIKSLKEGSGCYAACLTPTGKVLSDLRVCSLPDRLLILLPNKEKRKILEHLDKFIFMEEVVVKDLEGKTDILSVQGPLSPKLMADVADDPLPFSLYHHRDVQAKGIASQIIRATHTGEEGFDVLVPLVEFSRFCTLLEERGRPYGLREIGEEAREVLRIEAAIPRYGMEMDESTILLEAGLEEAVSFTKGCYTGQEVIAKIKNIGHVNRLLAGLTFPVPAAGGNKIFHNDQEAGYVTSSCYSPAMQSDVALAMVRREVAKPKTPLTIKPPEGIQPATVVPLPFYVRK